VRFILKVLRFLSVFFSPEHEKQLMNPSVSQSMGAAALPQSEG
jgi:hypothetical protein